MATTTSTTGNALGALLTVDETARLLRLSASTVRRLARRGELPAVRFGRQWRIDLGDVGAYATTPTYEEPSNA